MIVLTGVYAGVKSMQRKKEVASETIIHTVAVPKISLKIARILICTILLSIAICYTISISKRKENTSKENTSKGMLHKAR